jgi:predicted nucleic acid-binding protein
MVFVDTSAFLAVLDSSELLHRAADGVWQRMLAGEDELVTTNYVLLELAAVVQSRLGLPAIRAFQNDVLPALRVDRPRGS